MREEETEKSRLLRLSRRLAPSFYDDVLFETRRNLTEGNRQVYAELGVAFADLAAEFGERSDWSESEEQDFLDRLPVTTRSVPVEMADQMPLAPAFRLYLEAMKLDKDSPETAKRKSELIFAANVMVTVSEQAGLQPYLDAAFARVSRFVQGDGIGRLPYLRGAVQVVAYSAQAIGQRLVTEFAIKVPVGDQSLGGGGKLRGRGTAACGRAICRSSPSQRRSRCGRITAAAPTTDEGRRLPTGPSCAIA